MRFPAVERSAVLVAGVYLAVSLVWIFGSDHLVEWTAGGDLAQVARWQTIKGVGFMLLTALGLYFMVARSLARQRRHDEELRKMEDMLSVSQRLEALGTLSATVVHDFNNIITVIRGMADLASLDGYDPAKMPGRMREIEKAVEQAHHIVRQLTHFMHQVPQAFAPGDLAEVIRGFEAMLRQALGRRVTLKVELGTEPLPPVGLDRSQIEQILLNLAVNARDAMDKSQRATLTLSTEVRTLLRHHTVFHPKPISGRFVVLTVADNGCGIPPENLVSIFSPFFTTKPEGKGTGLGLASVLRLMQKHQGWVEVDSVVGEGTRFHLFFPVCDVLAAPTPTPAIRP